MKAAEIYLMVFLALAPNFNKEKKQDITGTENLTKKVINYVKNHGDFKHEPLGNNIYIKYYEFITETITETEKDDDGYRYELAYSEECRKDTKTCKDPLFNMIYHIYGNEGDIVQLFKNKSPYSYNINLTDNSDEYFLFYIEDEEKDPILVTKLPRENMSKDEGKEIEKLYNLYLDDLIKGLGI